MGVTLRRLTCALAACVIVSGTVIGCAAARAPDLMLSLATPDDSSTPEGKQIEHFVDEVSRISGGTIAIRPNWLAGGRDTPRMDQTVSELAMKGKADLALVPARAWDEERVLSLRALNAPFLITNERLFEKVLDSDLRGRLLSGLPSAGVVGIDLFPQELRHPFGNGTAVLGRGDYVGQTFRVPASQTVWALFTALGATPVFAAADPATQRGAESSYNLAQSDVATGNVTFFPKASSLVASAQLRERLRDGQWDVLVRAAEATRNWAFDSLPTDFEAANDFCLRGGQIRAAGDGELKELRTAGDQVVAGLDRDQVSRDLITDIRTMKARTPDGDPVTSCPGTTTASASSTGASAIDGVYEFDVSEDAVRAAGATNETLIRENSGHFQFTLDHLHWSLHMTADHFIQFPDTNGSFSYEDGVLNISWNADPSDWSGGLVSVEPDGSLKFVDIRDGYSDPDHHALDLIEFIHWKRIGDVSPSTE